VIETDHKNLTYWKSPRKLMGRTARWHEKLQDYNFKILHVVGKNNTPANTLSRLCDNEQEQGERQLSLLPESAFLNLADARDPTSLEGVLVDTRRQYQPWFEARWEHQQWVDDQGLWLDENQKAIVPPDEDARQHIMHTYHDRLVAHPGRDKTVRKVMDRFCWPGGWAWIEQYIKGCAICQQNKNLTHRTKVPLYKITVPNNAPLFAQIAMDLITGLPKSRGHDSILTIVNHGCL